MSPNSSWWWRDGGSTRKRQCWQAKRVVEHRIWTAKYLARVVEHRIWTAKYLARVVEHRIWTAGYLAWVVEIRIWTAGYTFPSIVYGANSRVIVSETSISPNSNCQTFFQFVEGKLSSRSLRKRTFALRL
jgi:hypothetical protein